jgi:hypothetical protein
LTDTVNVPGVVSVTGLTASQLSPPVEAIYLTTALASLLVIAMVLDSGGTPPAWNTKLREVGFATGDGSVNGSGGRRPMVPL